MVFYKVVSTLFSTQMFAPITQTSVVSEPRRVVSTMYLAELDVTKVQSTNVSGESLTSNSWQASPFPMNIDISRVHFQTPITDELLEGCFSRTSVIPFTK